MLQLVSYSRRHADWLSRFRRQRLEAAQRRAGRRRFGRRLGHRPKAPCGLPAARRVDPQRRGDGPGARAPLAPRPRAPGVDARGLRRAREAAAHQTAKRFGTIRGGARRETRR